MSAAGIIFSNLHEAHITELTKVRTMAAVPFMARYRLVDFPLSNMINSGITNVSVITHYNYHSLMNHIGSGKDWDLARRNGGIQILPPFITAYANNSNSLYSTRLEALCSINHSISNIKDDFIVLCDCDCICNIDIKEILEEHEEKKADLTVVVQKKNVTDEERAKFTIIEADADGHITDAFTNSGMTSGEKHVSLNIMVITRQFMSNMLADTMAHSYKSFTYDIIGRYKGSRNFRIHEFNGHYSAVDSFVGYFNQSMKILRTESIREEIFGNKNRPIFTRIRNSVPTRYKTGCIVRNSFIADGCIIEGTVENSILARNVKIGKNAVVRNSILFRNTTVGEHAELDYVLSDKNATIRDGRHLSGCDALPYFIDKGMNL